MPRLKLSNTAINRLKSPDPSGRQCLHWDTDLKGFGVLASGKTNARTYIVQRDVNGKSRRVTIGATNVFSLEDARTDTQYNLLKKLAGDGHRVVRDGCNVMLAFEVPINEER